MLSKLTIFSNDHKTNSIELSKITVSLPKGANFKKKINKNKIIIIIIIIITVC